MSLAFFMMIHTYRSRYCKINYFVKESDEIHLFSQLKFVKEYQRNVSGHYQILKLRKFLPKKIIIPLEKER